MTVRRFSVSDAPFEKAPDQDGDVVLGNVVDQRQGSPLSVGYGRYGPNQHNSETLAVDEAMVILEGELSVTTADGTVTGRASEIVYMPKHAAVTYQSGPTGAVIVYVTYPHWRDGP